MRISKLKITTIILFLFLLTGLVRIQVCKRHYYKNLSQDNSIRVVPIKAARGNIYDRNGKVLAESRLSFNVAAIPNDLISENETFNILSEILEMPVSFLKKRMKNNMVNSFSPAVIAEGISQEKAILIEEQKFQLPGIIIQAQPQRHYAHSESAAHVVGYVSQLNKEELRKLKPFGWRSVDLIGRTGIEKAFNSYLKGQNGGYQVLTDSKGRYLKVLGSKEPKKGKDIHLSIDADLQDYIYELLKDRKAAVTVWNPNNGKMLAIVSIPSFDPNIFVTLGLKENEEIKQLLSSDSYPLINRNIQAEYPTGSVFKIVTAIAALESQAIDQNTTLNCPGYFKLGGSSFRCWKETGHGQVDIIKGLKYSCNVFFYNIGLKVGVDDLVRYANIFGFGKKTGINLPGEADGLVPSKKWKQKTKGQPWYDGETVIFAIGQGYFLATPLQVLRMASCIANGGSLTFPQLVEKIEDVKIGQKTPQDLGFHKENIDLVRKGLEKVVSRYGTGTLAQIEGLDIAGKTATAQTSTGAAHAWFLSFFPTDNAQYAMVVFIEHGGSGGNVAAPIAKKIITYIKDNYMQEKDKL
jgi:penicillin-binding protein 2